MEQKKEFIEKVSRSIIFPYAFSPQENGESPWDGWINTITWPEVQKLIAILLNSTDAFNLMKITNEHIHQTGIKNLGSFIGQASKRFEPKVIRPDLMKYLQNNTHYPATLLLFEDLGDPHFIPTLLEIGHLKEDAERLATRTCVDIIIDHFEEDHPDKLNTLLKEIEPFTHGYPVLKNWIEKKLAIG